jgi:hypothetical protein
MFFTVTRPLTSLPSALPTLFKPLLIHSAAGTLAGLQSFASEPPHVPRAAALALVGDPPTLWTVLARRDGLSLHTSPSRPSPQMRIPSASLTRALRRRSAVSRSLPGCFDYKSRSFKETLVFQLQLEKWTDSARCCYIGFTGKRFKNDVKRFHCWRESH